MTYFTAGLSTTHGFFTRFGGVSQGIYAETNCGLGSNDEKARILQNRAYVAGCMGLAANKLYTLHQCHSAEVLTITSKTDAMLVRGQQADAFVTSQPDIGLGILTADCMPVLFTGGKNMDDQNSTNVPSGATSVPYIGAAHAGWRGALRGVLENTVTALEALGAEKKSIKAVIGPSIGFERFEIGEDVVDQVRNHPAFQSSLLKKSPFTEQRFLFDLKGFGKNILQGLGVAVEVMPECTYQDDRFFSYRRATHENAPDYGRQISVITLKNNNTSLEI